MDNLFPDGSKRTQKDPPLPNEGSTTGKAQNVSESKQSENREETNQDTSFEGFGRFKVKAANMLTLLDVITLAIYLSFDRGIIDRLKRSETPGLDMILELESKGVISPTDISGLVTGLKGCDRSGIASMVEYSFQTNVSAHLRSQQLPFQGKKDLFISRLRRIYKILYDAVQPLPYVKDRMCCVDKLFIQGNIQRRSTDDRGKEAWQFVESYHDILEIEKQSRNESTRYIILGDPGYGKSTLSLQFLYDWCNNVQQSPLKDVEIVIFLRMRQLGGFTSIYQAIKRLLLPLDTPLTVDDIRAIVQNTKSTLILFDGYDEYPDKRNANTDFTAILKMKKLLDTHVMLTTRSAHVRETPNELKTQSTHFQLTGFTPTDQDKYIMKAVVGGDVEAARAVRDKLNENPVLDDICQIPLFFTIAAHATHDKKNIIPNTKSITWFFRFIQECFFKHTSNKEDSGEVSSETARAKLSKIAFEGLSRENQQIVWNKQLFVEMLGEQNYNNLIRTGILTEDERIYVADKADVKSAFFQQLATTSFYHKLFCESYAAFYLVDLIRKLIDNASASSASDVAAGSVWKDAKDLLSSLDHKDLQYLFRFACGLDAKAGCVIIDYLVKQTDDKNLAILCIFEFTGEDEDIADAVKKLCYPFAKIHGEDSKILQRAKVRVLEIASRCNVPIPDLQLRLSFSYVDKCDIVLRSGLRLPSLTSIEKISINAKRASEDDVNGLLNYGLQSQSFKEIWFYYCELPESFRCEGIPALAKARNVKVLRPCHALQLALESGQWTKIMEIEDIRKLCSDAVVIDNKTSGSVQMSVIDTLVKASSHDIPIFRVGLNKSFNSIVVDDVILSSGLSLPILSSLERMLVQTEDGRELTKDEANGILNHLRYSERLKEVGFYFCLLPPFLSGSFLPVMRSRNVKVFWSPYGFYQRSYRFDLAGGYWLLGEDHASLFPGRSTGDKLDSEDYNKEVTAFRAHWRDKQTSSNVD